MLHFPLAKSYMSGLQPSGSLGLSTWAFGPGWYMVGPLALRLMEGSGLMRLRSRH